MTIRAVVWDIDDTLYDYTGADRAAALRHFEAAGLLARFVSPEAAFARWDAVMRATYARFLARELSFVDMRRVRVRTFLGEPLDDAEADRWFAGYLACREGADALFPDVLPALDALAGGYRFGLLSNSSGPHQERKLRALGVRERFEVLLCSDELGFAKPAPQAFLAACAALGLPPDEVAYVGDQPDTDAAAAHAAGLHGVWLDRPAGADRPTGADRADRSDSGVRPTASGGPHRITCLSELPALLAGLRPGPPA